MRHCLPLLLVVLTAGCTRSSEQAAPALRLAQAGDAPLATAPDAPELVLLVTAHPTDMQISPDGETLTVVDRERFIQRWRVADLMLIDAWTAEGPATLADGGEYALVYESPWRNTGSAEVLELRSRAPAATLETRAAINLPRFLSPDGSLGVAEFVSGKPVLSLIQTDSHRELPEAATEGRSVWISAVAFDGDTVLLGFADGAVRLWDTETDRVLTLRPSPENWIPPMVSSVWPAPDPRVSDVDLRAGLAAAAGPEIGCFVWNAATGELLAQPIEPGHPERGGRASRVAISPTGDEVAFAVSDTIRVWNIAREEASSLTAPWPRDPGEEPTPRALTDASRPRYDSDRRVSEAICVRYTNNGTLLAAGSHYGQAWLWREDQDQGERPVGICPTPYYQQAVPVAAKVSTEDGLTVWARGLTPPMLYDTFPQGAQLALEDDGMRRILRWQLRRGRGDQPAQFALWGTQLHVLPEAGLIRTAAGSLGARPLSDLWSADSAEAVPAAEPLPRPSTAISATPDGTLVAVPEQRRVRLISLPGGEETRAIECDEEGLYPVGAVALSADGSRLAVHCGNVLIFDLTTGAEVMRLPTDHGLMGGNAIALSRGGERLAVGHAAGLEIYSTESGERLGYGPSKSDYPASTMFSPDGATVASASPDGAIFLHDGTTGELRASVSAHGSTRTLSTDWPGAYGFAVGGVSSLPAISFSSDSRLLVSVGADATVAIVDVASGEVLVRLIWVGGPGVASGGWIAWTPDGRYDGTNDAIEACIRFTSGDEMVPASRFPELRVEGLVDRMLGR